MQFSCPKSVTLQALVGQDHRLTEAHEQAVRTAIQEVEKFALSRQHRGQEWVVTGNVVAAKFTHTSSRPASNGMIDPQLHSHVVFVNCTHAGNSATEQRQAEAVYSLGYLTRHVK